MAFQKVCIIGHTGSVGSELVRQISVRDGAEHGHLNPTDIVGLVNTRGHVIDPHGISGAVELTDRERFAEVATPHARLESIVDEVRRLGLAGEVVFVDVTADATKVMLNVHKAIRRARELMVTANKSQLSLFPYEDFDFLTSEPNLYRYNASVMAGGDAVTYLQDSRLISDPIQAIEGCFSGTLGYITSELEKEEKPFSKIVRDACEQKYTEPHPWDDLSGKDVARKLLILARTAGLKVNMEDVRLESFIEREYGEMQSVPDFLDALQRKDADFARQMREAKVQGETMRYVAELKAGHNGPELAVGLKRVRKDDILGQLQGTANLVRIITRDRAPAESPHVIIAKGAGVPKTAAAVRVDLARMLPNSRVSCQPVNGAAVA